MKVSAAVSAAFAGSAMAAGAADTVNQVLNDINSALKSFDTAIKGYTGGSADALNQAAGKIQSITSSGAQKIASGSDLTLNDAVSITTNVQGLQTTIDATLSDLEGIGSKIASSGQCGVITSSLTSQNTAAKALQDAITQKAPTETKSIAQQLGGKIGASISNTQSKFATICAGAPSGGSSSSGSSSSSSGSSGSSGSSSSGHAAGGHSGSPTTGSRASSAVPKPAQYTGSATSLSACRALGLGFAAAILAL
jgi:hypothetical protein